jgi:hypothetical protein
MKRLVICLSVLVLLAGIAADAAAGGRHHHHGHHGHHGHWHGSIGLHFGDPFFWGHHYYRPWPPLYYSPPTVIVEREPPVYVQRQPAQVWYYCPNPAGYYPYVSSCSQQWVTVDPSNVPPAPPR